MVLLQHPNVLRNASYYNTIPQIARCPVSLVFRQGLKYTAITVLEKLGDMSGYEWSDPDWLVSEKITSVQVQLSICWLR